MLGKKQYEKNNSYLIKCEAASPERVSSGILAQKQSNQESVLLEFSKRNPSRNPPIQRTNQQPRSKTYQSGTLPISSKWINQLRIQPGGSFLGLP